MIRLVKVKHKIYQTVSVLGQHEGYTVRVVSRECTVKYTTRLKVIFKELYLSIPSFTIIYCHICYAPFPCVFFLRKKIILLFFHFKVFSMVGEVQS